MDEEDIEVEADQKFSSNLEDRIIQLEGRLQSTLEDFTIVGPGISGSAGDGFQYNAE